MKIAGNRTIFAPQAVVESALRDGQRLAQAISDFQLGTPLDEQQQRATLTIRVGPMRGQYESILTITQTKSAVWEITFDGHSAQGIFQGHGRIHLTSQNEQTIIQYEINIEVAGQLANLPPRLLYANVHAVIRRFLDGVEHVLWPENFAVEPELDNGLLLWLKTAVPITILLLGIFWLNNLLKKRLK